LLGEGIFTQDGPPWKRSRELLRRQFARIQYQNLKVFHEHVNELVDGLSASSGIVDLQPAFFRFTLATTTALIFGEPIGSLEDEDQDTFANCFDYASFICAIRLRLADFHWAYTPTKFTKACGIVKQYANHFVKQALKDREDNGEKADSGRYAFILDLYKELQDPALVRDQLVNVLIAGRDTTACLMSWTL
jgi:cytochrome P450